MFFITISQLMHIFATQKLIIGIIMKRFVFLMTAIFIININMASAVDISHLRQIGLPTKAVPAILYFQNLFVNTPHTITDDDVANSSLCGFDDEYFYFVESLPSSEDDLFVRINLWMYESEKDKVTKIFSQEGDKYEELFIMGIDWLLDKQSTFKDVVVEDSKQTIGVQEFTSNPVVILKAETFTGFVHAPQMTLLVYPSSKEVKTLENEILVSVAHTLSNMLMSAEMEYAQDYIITTSTDMRSEQQPLKETEEYILFNKQYLTPTIHVYSARGELVGRLTLPEDEVDMIR